MAGRGAQYVVIAEKYLVVDIGGGTVDISSHCIEGGCIKKLAQPVGKFWGGTAVNEKFSKFLEEFVDDPHFSRYIDKSSPDSPEKEIRHRAHLNKLLYFRFERQKRRFGSEEGRDSYDVEFPGTFVSLYKDSIVEKGKTLNSKGDMSVKIEDDGAVMKISKSKMAEFFKPAIDEIADLIEFHLRQNDIANTTWTIYWVGGFGGCKYLRNQLEERINKTFRGCTYHFAVPPEPEFAVIRGATVSPYDPSITVNETGKLLTVHKFLCKHSIVYCIHVTIMTSCKFGKGCSTVDVLCSDTIYSTVVSFPFHHPTFIQQ